MCYTWACLRLREATLAFPTMIDSNGSAPPNPNPPNTFNDYIYRIVAKAVGCINDKDRVTAVLVLRVLEEAPRQAMEHSAAP